jgi:hypothetical protein
MTSQCPRTTPAVTPESRGKRTPIWRSARVGPRGIARQSEREPSDLPQTRRGHSRMSRALRPWGSAPTAALSTGIGGPLSTQPWSGRVSTVALVGRLRRRDLIWIVCPIGGSGQPVISSRSGVMSMWNSIPRARESRMSVAREGS